MGGRAVRRGVTATLLGAALTAALGGAASADGLLDALDLKGSFGTAGGSLALPAPTGDRG